MKKKRWKKSFTIIGIAFLLTACVKEKVLEKSIESPQEAEKIESPKTIEKVKEAELYEPVQEIREATMYEPVQKVEKPIPYHVPLEEIAKKLEYACRLKHYQEEIDWGYGELDPFPEKGVINVSFYIVDGNRILFLPEGKGNTEILVGNQLCEAYESKELGGYLFYMLSNWGVSEYGVPLNDLETSSIRYCTVRKGTTKEKDITKMPGDSLRNHYSVEYSFTDLVWLGKTKVNMEVDDSFQLPPINIEENDYIEGLKNHIVERAKDAKRYGSYDIYIRSMKRGGQMEEYYGTNCSIEFAIVGDRFRQYKNYCVGDDMEMEWTWQDVLFRTSPWIQDEELVDRTIRDARGVFHIEVNKDTEVRAKSRHKYEKERGLRDFSKLSLKEALDLIEYTWSYGEWFGMNELGYKYGTVRSLEGKEIDVFLSSREDRLYFRLVEDEEEEYYRIWRSDYRQQEGQLETGLIHIGLSTKGPVDTIEKELGRGRIEGRKLPELEVKKIEEDSYVLAMEDYIKDLLVSGGEKGEFEITFGEYEALFPNKVCLSAAVTGERDYYIRCLIVKYGEDEEEKYYFWPVGFGLNGSLEECGADIHYMNQVSIERTKQLNRHRRQIWIP